MEGRRGTEREKEREREKKNVAARNTASCICQHVVLVGVVTCLCDVTMLNFSSEVNNRSDSDSVSNAKTKSNN